MRKSSSYKTDDTFPNDVLSGKGNGAKQHGGNKHFRELVQLAKEIYISSPESKKIMISELVFNAVKNLSPPGRYLKKDEKGAWYELSKKEALTKTSQALREGQPSHKKTGCFPCIQDAVTFNDKLNEVKAILEIKTKEKNDEARKDIPNKMPVAPADADISDFVRNNSNIVPQGGNILRRFSMPPLLDPLSFQDKYLSYEKAIIMSDFTVHTFDKNGDISSHSRKSMYVGMHPDEQVDACVRYKRDSITRNSDQLAYWRRNKIQKTNHPDESTSLPKSWDRFSPDEVNSSTILHSMQGIKHLTPLGSILRDSSHWSLDAEILGGTLLRETSLVADKK